MKLVLVFLSVMCTALLINAAGNDNQMTNEEVQELINDYKELNTNNGMNAPVSSETSSLLLWNRNFSFSQIREMAQKTKDLTMKYFKTVGVEIAKHMCNQLDNILIAFNANEDKNDI